MMLEKYTLTSFIFIAVSLFLNFGITGVGQADDTPILSDTNDTVIKKIDTYELCTSCHAYLVMLKTSKL